MLGTSSMFMFFLLRCPTKPWYRDVTMHAQYFFSRERGKTLGQEGPTCDKEGREGKGEMDHLRYDENCFTSLPQKYCACIVTSQ